MLFIFHLRSSTLPLKYSPKCALVLTRIMLCTIVHIINLVESVFVFLPPAFSAMSRACWEQQVIQVLSNESGQAAARGALLFRQGDLDAMPGGRSFRPSMSTWIRFSPAEGCSPEEGRGREEKLIPEQN